MSKLNLLFSFLLILLLANTTEAGLLSKQDTYNFLDPPKKFSSGCNLNEVCLGIISNSTLNGQIIKIDDNFGKIEGIGLVLKRNELIRSTWGLFNIKVYKSTTNNPNTASFYLWDSTTLDITHSHTNMGLYTFYFDYEIPVYEGDTKILNHIFIEISETYPDIDNCNYVYYAFALFEGIDKYYNGSLYYKYGTTWYNYGQYVNWGEPNTFGDMVFYLYGQYKFPTTPLPTPIVEAPSENTTELPEGCTWTDFYNGLCINMPPITDVWIAVPSSDDYNWTKSKEEIAPGILGNESILITGIPKDKQSSKFLKSFGYCKDGTCTSEDIISMLYDFAIILNIFSFFVLMFKFMKVKK